MSSSSGWRIPSDFLVWDEYRRGTNAIIGQRARQNAPRILEHSTSRARASHVLNYQLSPYRQCAFLQQAFSGNAHWAVITSGDSISALSDVTFVYCLSACSSTDYPAAAEAPPSFSVSTRSSKRCVSRDWCRLPCGRAIVGQPSYQVGSLIGKPTKGKDWLFRKDRDHRSPRWRYPQDNEAPHLGRPARPPTQSRRCLRRLPSGAESDAAKQAFWSDLLACQNWSPGCTPE